MRLLVIGGAGFMGSNFVRYVLERHSGVRVVVYDKLTYAGRLDNLRDVFDHPGFGFVYGDLLDEERLTWAIREFEPDVVVNFAAETHVDRSISEPAPFIETNVVGVFYLLEAARRLDVPRLVHISTDEVYGDRWGLPPAEEDECFRPGSPYAASKAAGDLFAQSYWRTYRVPVIVLRPSNNYGPFQYPEKLIPRTIIRALHDKPIPLYGGGWQKRDWLYVGDFSEALWTVITKGVPGEAYNVPGFNEKSNLEVVRDILRVLGKPETLIRVVEDRPGHDRRYAMRGDKILGLGWKPRTPWLEGLKKTIEWYLVNRWWWEPLLGDKFFAVDTPWQ